jgi:hypothetical protein
LTDTGALHSLRGQVLSLVAFLPGVMLRLLLLLYGGLDFVSERNVTVADDKLPAAVSADCVLLSEQCKAQRHPAGDTVRELIRLIRSFLCTHFCGHVRRQS